jgi:hypothetical protein
MAQGYRTRNEAIVVSLLTIVAMFIRNFVLLMIFIPLAGFMGRCRWAPRRIVVRRLPNLRSRRSRHVNSNE